MRWQHAISIDLPPSDEAAKPSDDTKQRRPRGRPPNDEHGCPKDWDSEAGCWRDSSGAEHVAHAESPVTPHEPLRKQVFFPRDGTLPEPVLRFADALNMSLQDWDRIYAFFSQQAGSDQAADEAQHDSVVLRRTEASEIVLYMQRGTDVWSINVRPSI
ncbi:MAG: hypothetical protein CMM02_21360 [Rhodopirellula sp.]|nr:hypothetical protein [Rhodopirellula sp.]